jgi:hypothetical protein
MKQPTSSQCRQVGAVQVVTAGGRAELHMSAEHPGMQDGWQLCSGGRKIRMIVISGACIAATGLLKVNSQMCLPIPMALRPRATVRTCRCSGSGALALQVKHATSAVHSCSSPCLQQPPAANHVSHRKRVSSAAGAEQLPRHRVSPRRMSDNQLHHHRPQHCTGRSIAGGAPQQHALSRRCASWPNQGQHCQVREMRLMAWWGIPDRFAGERDAVLSSTSAASAIQQSHPVGDKLEQSCRWWQCTAVLECATLLSLGLRITATHEPQLPSPGLWLRCDG